jgi:hypothetical protein
VYLKSVLVHLKSVLVYLKSVLEYLKCTLSAERDRVFDECAFSELKSVLVFLKSVSEERVYLKSVLVHPNACSWI